MKGLLFTIAVLVMFISISSCKKAPVSLFTGSYAGDLTYNLNYAVIQTRFTIQPTNSESELIIYNEEYGYTFTGLVSDTNITISSQHVVAVTPLAKESYANYTLSGKGSFSKTGSLLNLVLSDSNGGYNFGGKKW